VIIIAKGSMVAMGMEKKGIKAAGGWYRVETYTNTGPVNTSEPSCGCGHIKNKGGTKPTCGYSSSHHWARDHKCNIVGSTAKQGLLCGHTPKKSPKCIGNHIAFSN
jgi:hypothetical protein